MRVELGWVSRAGVRPDNQDSVLVDGMIGIGDVAGEATREVVAGRPLLAAVLDGLGGHAAGGIASRVAGAVLATAPVPEDEQVLAERLDRAHRTLADLGQQLPGAAGMGTTATCAVVLPGALLVGQVGDSALFRLTERAFGRLTDAHRSPDPWHPDAHVLTRALGPGAVPDADVDRYAVPHATRLLLCSDGVADVLAMNDVKELLGRGTPASSARSCVDAAARAGSQDNLTALVVELLPG